MKKSVPLIISLLFVLIALSIQISYSLQHLDIIPQKFSDTIVTYSDSSIVAANGGKSDISIDSVTDKGLFYHYRLDSTFAYYYAGIQFHFPTSKLINLTKYSHINIKIDGGNSSTMRFFLLTDEQGISKPTDATTWRHLRAYIPTREGKKSYTIELNSLNTPQWWFETYNTSAPLLSKIPISRVRGVKIESGEGEPTNIIESIIIQKIRFYTPVPPLYKTIQILLIILTLLLLAFRFGIIKRVQLGNYKPIILGNLFERT